MATARRLSAQIAEGAPGWARAVAANAADVTPAVARSATPAQRTAAADAWLRLSQHDHIAEPLDDWAVSVLTQALSSIIFCLELNAADDSHRWLTATEQLVARIEAAPRPISDAVHARALHTIAIYRERIVEVSTATGPVGSLLAAARAATEALSVPGDEIPAEARARRHHTLAVIARKLAHAGQGRHWWDEAVRNDRAATGLDPAGADLPAPSEVHSTTGPAVELATRWQGLAIAYRARGAALGAIADLELAVRAADISLHLLPLEDPTRGGPLMARGGALMSLAERVDAPSTHVAAAVEAYRMAVALPSDGAARRQKRLTSLGLALRRLHHLSRHQPDYRDAHLQDSVHFLTEAVNLTPSNARERPRLLANLANALLNRAELNGHVPDLDHAVTLYRRALEGSLGQDGGQNRDVPQHQLLLAVALERRADGINSEIEDLHTEAMNRYSDLDHALYIRAARAYAEMLRRHNRPEDAVTTLRHVIERVATNQDPRVRADLQELQCDTAHLLAAGGNASAAAQMVVPHATGHTVVLVPSARAGTILVKAPESEWKSFLSPALRWKALRRARDVLQHRYRSGEDDRPSDNDIEQAVHTAHEVIAPAHVYLRGAPATGAVTLVAVGAARDLPVAMPLRPKCTVIARSGDQLDERSSESSPSRSVLALVSDEPDLTGTTVEVAIIRRLFGTKLTVHRSTNTKPSAWTGETVDILHAAAHGTEIEGTPAVALAADKMVTVEQLRRNGPIPPIVVLTVCPTAYKHDQPYPPRRLSDDLLDAGAEAVIAPLWPVRDAVAPAFAATFYDRLALDDPSPTLKATVATALTAAIDDLTTMTAAELLHHHPELRVLSPFRNRTSGKPPFAALRDTAAWACWG